MAIQKADMPSFQFLAGYLNVKTRQTAAARFKKLVEGGYVKYNEELKIYELPLVEKYHYPVAPATLRFLLDTVQERVIKLYLYLGQRFKYKGQGYTFTIQEICQHLGIDYTHSSAIAAHGLELLEKVGLISVQHFYEGYYHRFRLLEFNTQVPLHYDKLTPTE